MRVFFVRPQILDEIGFELRGKGRDLLDSISPDNQAAFIPDQCCILILAGEGEICDAVEDLLSVGSLSYGSDFRPTWIRVSALM
jgi:hypothetical protein